MGGRRSLALIHTVVDPGHQEPNQGSLSSVGMLEHLGCRVMMRDGGVS